MWPEGTTEPLQQLHSICDHWFGDTSCSVCQLLFPLLVNKVIWSYSHSSTRAGDPFQNKQMAPSFRHTASESAASFPCSLEPATFPVCFGHKSIKLQSCLVQSFKNKSIQMSEKRLHDTMIIELYKYVDQKIFPGKSSMLLMSRRKAKRTYLPAKLHIHTGHIDCYAGASRSPD